MKRGRPEKYNEEVERLIDNGWTIKDIVSKTNISQATVYRVLDKLKRRARHDFKNLMQHDFLWKYQKTLENYDKTVRQCNEQIDSLKIEYNQLKQLTLMDLENTPDNKHMARATLLSNLINIQSNRTNELQKLVTARDKASDSKAKVYNQGPVVNAIDEWVQKNTPSLGELPRIPELDSDEFKVTTKLNTTEETNNVIKMTEDDIKTLEEMNKDE